MEATERGKVKPLPCTSDIQGNGNANDPRNDDCDAITWLVQKFFDSTPLTCQECVYFREASEICEALENGEAEICPELDSLIEDNVREAMQDQQGCYP
jgi:hypothetical protein